MTNKEFTNLCKELDLTLMKKTVMITMPTQTSLCAFFYVNGRLHSIEKKSNCRTAHLHENYNRYCRFRTIYSDKSIANFTNRVKDVMNLGNVELNLAY